MAECFSPPILAFVCSGPMSIKALSKISLAIAFVGVAGWRAISHPAYLDLSSISPRQKPDFRTKCPFFHYPPSKSKYPNFLTEFGRVFKTIRYRITPEMREKFNEIFLSADQPVSGITADTISLSTSQVIVNITVKNARGKYVPTLDRQAFTLLEDDREQEVVQFFGEDAPIPVTLPP